MLEFVQYILLLFLLFYLLILIYDIAFLRSKSRKDKISKTKINIIIELITEFENSSKEEKNKISKKIISKLKRLSYLYCLGLLLEKNENINGTYIIDILCKKSYDNIFIKLTEIYSKKDLLSKTYYAYILKYICKKDEKIYDFLYELVVSPSIYSTESALMAVYHIGEASLVVSAYKKMSKKNILYSNKLISDGLLEYTGNKNELCSKLYGNFDKFNEEIKIGILTYFRNCKYNVKEELLERLEAKNNEKEVEIAMIRYFSKVYYKKAIDLFIKRLEEEYYDDFEYAVVMIQSIIIVDVLTKNMVSVLKKCLCDSNYYVRLNAAKVLKEKNDLRTLEDIHDKYAKDMIKYVMSEEV